MNRLLRKLELFTDEAIPYALIALAIVIVIEFFFEEIAHKFELTLLIIDNLVVLLFVIDLIYKYVRIKPFSKFLKHSWLDIIAIFPFVLVFRFVEFMIDLVYFEKMIKEGQTVLHESVELQKEISIIIRHVEHGRQMSRSGKLIRLIRPLSRLPRFLKAFTFFEKPFPHGKEHELKNELLKKEYSK